MMAKHKRAKRRNICPICAKPRLQAGLPLTVPFGVPTYWSPEQALAIFEMIDEMRAVIVAVYGMHLQDAARNQYQQPPDHRPVIPDEELPF
jgi:hypothetical protein